MRLRLSSGLLGALWLGALATMAVPAGAAGPAGALTGTIRFGGAPPKPVQLEVSKDRDTCAVRPLYDQSLVVGAAGGIANAVVTLPNPPGAPAPRPRTAVRFEQVGCEYVPHVAVFPAGSTVEVINADGILHNIHTESVVNPVLDMAQPGFKKTISVTIGKPEAIKVTCDAHNWMEGWWYATSTPYYALTDPHGHYAINNVPPGTYELHIWQEKLGEQTRQVTIKPGATTVADFTLTPSNK